ncbi:23S rRNA (guanosine(2251)-2'-O)-methyltransferase RlmB [Bacteroidia bacterium]|nr:23S rRNA (guanosine(2251)-2'-O)-methyltransferase RlmB [Bacteroidia bacterium]MDB9883179.1 23S rRNA (guanosine(2251)-2'-O)-methyltransferase RlmB [Bacteroidia bacterium]
MSREGVVIGYHAVEELLQSGVTIGKVYVNSQADRHKIGALRQLAKVNDTPFQMVPLEKLNRITRANHQGVIAIKSPIDFVPLEETITRMYEEGKPPKILVADGIQDIRNIGAISRSCLAFGIDLMIVGVKANAEIGEGAIKSSAGALLKLPVARVSSLASTLTYLKSWGLTQIAATEKSDVVLSSDSFKDLDSWVLWMGNEDSGLSRERMALMDKTICINMPGEIDSLNVSVATGIVLHTLTSR